MLRSNVFVYAVTSLLLCSAATVSASPLAYIELLGSTTQAGSYSSTVSAPAGSTIYYELALVSAPSGTTSTHTAATPDGVHDSVNILPVFTFSDSIGTFSTAVLATSPDNFNNTTGTNVTIENSGTLLSVRAGAASGTYYNDDSPAVLVTGTFVVGTQSVDTVSGAYASSSGGLEVGVNSTKILPSSSTETGSDPYLGYDALSITVGESTPEPASLGLLGVGGLAMMRRRRTGTITGAKA